MLTGSIDDLGKSSKEVLEVITCQPPAMCTKPSMKETFKGNPSKVALKLMLKKTETVQERELAAIWLSAGLDTGRP